MFETSILFIPSRISSSEGLRELKEEYIQFNHTEYDNEFDVLLDLNALIDKYDKSDQSIFRDRLIRFVIFINQCV